MSELPKAPAGGGGRVGIWSPWLFGSPHDPVPLMGGGGKFSASWKLKPRCLSAGFSGLVAGERVCAAPLIIKIAARKRLTVVAARYATGVRLLCETE